MTNKESRELRRARHQILKRVAALGRVISDRTLELAAGFKLADNRRNRAIHTERILARQEHDVYHGRSDHGCGGECNDYGCP